MSTQTNKIFVPGSAKSQETSIGTVIRMGFNVEKLSEFIAKHANEKGWINFDLVPKKEIGQYGDTHSIVLNDWKPKSDNASANKAPAKQAKSKMTKAPEENDGEDIPF